MDCQNLNEGLSGYSNLIDYEKRITIRRIEGVWEIQLLMKGG